MLRKVKDVMSKRENIVISEEEILKQNQEVTIENIVFRGGWLHFVLFNTTLIIVISIYKILVHKEGI